MLHDAANAYSNLCKYFNFIVIIVITIVAIVAMVSVGELQS